MIFVEQKNQSSPNSYGTKTKINLPKILVKFKGNSIFPEILAALKLTIIYLSCAQGGSLPH